MKTISILYQYSILFSQKNFLILQNIHIDYHIVLSISEIPRQDREKWQCLRSRPGNNQ